MNKAKGFFRNTAIMFISMFIVKALGAVLKIPLGNILGGEGMGYFSTAFSIFSPVLAFTCSGIPAVVTQLVAGKAAKGLTKDILHIRRSAVMLALLFGIIGTSLIYITAVPFTYHIANSPESLMSVMIIAPSVLFCSVAAVYRGYYEGLSDMLPTALSQVIESLVKAAVGVGLSYYVYEKCVISFGSEEKALPYAAAAAIFGVTVSELCGMLYIFIRSRRNDSDCPKAVHKEISSGTITTMKNLFLSSLPVAAGAVLANLISFTDLLTVSNCINLSYHYFPDQLIGNTVKMSVLDAQTADPGNFLYGSYSGMVMSVYLLTASLPLLISRCSLPRLVCTAELNKNGDNIAVVRDINVMMKATMLISAPVSMFMAVLSEPLLKILYPVREMEAAVGVAPLQILSIGGIFASLQGALACVFQAYGDFKTPLRVTLADGLVKFLLNVVLMLIPGVNISGAALATAASNLFGTFYVQHLLKKKFGLKLSIANVAFPSFISAGISSLAVFYVYNLFIKEFNSIISVLLSCCFGGILYFLILLISDSGELFKIINSLRNKKCGKVL